MSFHGTNLSFLEKMYSRGVCEFVQGRTRGRRSILGYASPNVSTPETIYMERRRAWMRDMKAPTMARTTGFRMAMVKAKGRVRKLPAEGDESMTRALTGSSECGIDGYLDDMRSPRIVSCVPPPYLTCQGVLGKLEGSSSIPFENECTRIRGQTPVTVDPCVELAIVGRQPRLSRASTTAMSRPCCNNA